MGDSKFPSLCDGGLGQLLTYQEEDFWLKQRETSIQDWKNIAIGGS